MNIHSSKEEGEMRFGAGIWMFGQFIDRYATDGYGPSVDTIEAIERAGSLGELEVLDLNFPFSDADIGVAEVERALEANGLRAATVTPAIYTREFRLGGFTSPDPATRRKALELCEQAMDVARRLGAPTVKLWPGQDGYDFPLQCDHRELWRLALEGVRTVAAMDPNVRVAIEYKPKEPRTHLIFSTAARTLLGLDEIGRDDIGIVMDLGHSLYARETPADVLQLIHDRGRLFTIEVNDNWREWDDDLTVGGVHLIETLEFFLAVRDIGWKESIVLDQFPYREDPVEAGRASIQAIRAIDRALDRLDRDALREAQERQDPLAAQRLVRDLLFGQVPVA
jgi:xylose isomerase